MSLFQSTDEEVVRAYEEFYEDVHTEFLKFGEIVNFKVALILDRKLDTKVHFLLIIFLLSIFWIWAAIHHMGKALDFIVVILQ